MTVRSILTDCAVDLLRTENEVSVEQIVFCARRNHPEEFAAEAENMVLNAARRVAKDVMRDLSEDDVTQGRFELGGYTLPSAIAVPAEHGGYVYVRSDKATWPQLQAGRLVRAANVEAAQKKLDAYDDALNELRPVMAADRRVTVAEAVRSLRRGVA